MFLYIGCGRFLGGRRLPRECGRVGLLRWLPGGSEFFVAAVCALPAFGVVAGAGSAGPALEAALEDVCANSTFAVTAVSAPWLTWNIPASCAVACTELSCVEGVKVSWLAVALPAFPGPGVFAPLVKPMPLAVDACARFTTG